MYALVCRWEDAANRVDELLARAESLTTVGTEVPEALAVELAHAEQELLVATSMLQARQSGLQLH
ncbi:hypothetical protein [Pseudorhodoferax sp.]|uniref:hypothetical protein n=1 Tax=Pseudorhodoferax sp. TaxID=1993553 RepID=UPI002DD62AC9|nr:hypothetical protein [Pseudorhodoferax sp.]